MKTILVVYTNVKLTKKETQTLKRYAFNVSQRVVVGDMFTGDDYSTDMQVVEVMKTCYKYVNTHTGNLSNKRTGSTKQFEIRNLHIQAPYDVNAVVVSRV